MQISRRDLLAGAVSASMSTVMAQRRGGEYQVLIGTYTNNPKSKGIYSFRFDTANGKAGEPKLAAESTSPAFLSVHPTGRYVYAVNEIGKFEGKDTGSVSAFSVDAAAGTLKQLNVVESRGAGPAHLTVDRTGKYVLVANYSGGTLAVIRIQLDGTLGESTGFAQLTGQGGTPRQNRPYAHSVNVSPDNRFAMLCSLGLDEVLVYKLDPKTGSIAPNDPPFVKTPTGGGPRHFAFHPSSRWAYTNNEMGMSATAFSYDKKKGVLTEIQTISTLPAGYKGENLSTAEIVVHPNGKFLYVSNRGHDTIAVFSIANGKLTAVDHTPTQGQIPRNFALDPTGAYLFAANQRGDSVVIFRVDSKTGKLTPTGQKLEIGAPVCVRFVRAAKA